MVRLTDVDDAHQLDGVLTKTQVTAAVIEGAENAGWQAKDIGNDTVLATYAVRVHSVQVKIDVGDNFYVTRYKSSSGMKVFCSEGDKKRHRNMMVTGGQPCPGSRNPIYIHAGYKEWMDALNTAIQKSIASR
jgi:hypothetical protein